MTDRINIEPQVTGAEPPATEEPKLLAGKYKTQEDLEKGYLELQKKFSSTRPQEAVEEPPQDGTPSDPPADPPSDPPVSEPPQVPDADLDHRFNEFVEEYAEKGELSEETYKKLEGQGISKDIVDSYIAGQEAKAAETRKTVLSEVGGEDSFAKMAEWASQNLTQDVIDLYNDKLEGSVEEAKLALRDLASRYKQAQGPDLIEGETPPATSVGKFESWAQVTQAMQDPRYKTDEAYRAQVSKKLNASDL